MSIKAIITALFLTAIAAIAQTQKSTVSFNSITSMYEMPTVEVVAYSRIMPDDISLSKIDHQVIMPEGEYRSISTSIYSRKFGEVFLNYQEVSGLQLVIPEGPIEVSSDIQARVQFYILNQHGRDVKNITVNLYNDPAYSKKIGHINITVVIPTAIKVYQTSTASVNSSYFGKTYNIRHTIKYDKINFSIGLTGIQRDEAFSFDTKLQKTINASVSYNWDNLTLETPLGDKLKSIFVKEETK